MVIEKWTVGVDIGGTKIAFAGVDAAGNILHRIVVKTDVKGGETAVIQQIIEAVLQLQKEIGSSPIAVGVGMAGQIDAKSGNVFFAPNLSWHNVPLKVLLEKSLKISVHITNDVRAGTWGEWLLGAGKGCEDLVCVFVGTGIGGGIVSGGRILTGSSNTAGELGHITIDLHGRKCTCGNYGCLESVAGGWAIAERTREAIAKNPKEGTFLVNLGGEITTKMVVEAAHAKDPLAMRMIDETVDALIAGGVTIVNSFNPKRLIFGGGVINGMPEMVERIDRGIRLKALQAACQSLSVMPALLAGDTGVIGAAIYALKCE